MATTLESTDRPIPPDHRLPAAPDQPPPVKHRSLWWLWLLLLLAAGYGIYRWYQNTHQKSEAAATQQSARAANRPVPVVAATIRRGDIPIYLRGLGSVTAFNTVTVKTRVDGQLIQVAFKEGQFVNKGDFLAQIDPRPFQVVLDQALGQLERDKAQLNDAKVNLQRDQALWEGQVIAKQQLDTQAASVGQFEGTLTADQASINSAKLQVTYARITAPISGRIGLRLVDEGNIVHASDPNGLVVITQIQPIAVLFTIPADNLQPVLKKLRAGAKLEVDAYDRDDKTKLATGVSPDGRQHHRSNDGNVTSEIGVQQLRWRAIPEPICELPAALWTPSAALLIAPVPAHSAWASGFVSSMPWGPDKKAQVRPDHGGASSEGNDARGAQRATSWGCRGDRRTGSTAKRGIPVDVRPGGGRSGNSAATGKGLTRQPVERG